MVPQNREVGRQGGLKNAKCLAAAPVRSVGEVHNHRNELTLAPKELILREKASTLTAPQLPWHTTA